MEIFVSIVTALWVIASVVSFVSLLVAIFDDTLEKRAVVRALGAFVVATISTIALFAIALYIKFNI